MYMWLCTYVCMYIIILAVVHLWFISLLMKLLIGDENCALPLCAYVEVFCISGHICYQFLMCQLQSFREKVVVVTDRY